MEVNQLRIGNYVMAGSIEEIQIESINSKTKIVEANVRLCKSYCRHIDYYRAITLTDEWFHRLGFDVYESAIEDDRVVINKLINPIEYHLCSVKLESVHHLQNLYFALTGKELTKK